MNNLPVDQIIVWKLKDGVCRNDFYGSLMAIPFFPQDYTRSLLIEGAGEDRLAFSGRWVEENSDKITRLDTRSTETLPISRQDCAEVGDVIQDVFCGTFKMCLDVDEFNDPINWQRLEVDQ